MITFEQIKKVNEEMNFMDIKGKNYAMVPERVKAFRMLFPEGFIRTEIMSLEDGECVMQAKAGYYMEDGKEIILGTGMAYEKESNGYINKTSYIENCETSAVGRALGFLALGIDGGGICSAEELTNAISNQKVTPIKEAKGDPQTAAYLKSSTKLMMEAFGIQDEAEMKKKLMEMKKSLVESKIIPDVKFNEMTVAQAEEMVEAIFKNFNPNGDRK
jgi:hypothetical protein